MTDDTTSHPDHDGPPSAVTAGAAAPAPSGDTAARDADAAGVVVLVEEISIDGMCGVY